MEFNKDNVFTNLPDALNRSIYMDLKTRDMADNRHEQFNTQETRLERLQQRTPRYMDYYYNAREEYNEGYLNDLDAIKRQADKEYAEDKEQHQNEINKTIVEMVKIRERQTAALEQFNYLKRIMNI